jgi:16S rRNA (guanine966-N2)-methyltransferase
MRITGGTHRSRSLVAPRGDATRPTSDRVREALFGILASAGGVVGANVLDLYAGTGALALEALSRGAASATLVEPARAAVQAIRANVAALALDARVHLVQAPVERCLEAVVARAPFDLAFADPPYALVASGEAPRAIAALVASAAQGRAVLREGARLVLEHAKGDTPPDLAGLTLVDSRRYGDTAISFYEPAAPTSAVTPARGT